MVITVTLISLLDFRYLVSKWHFTPSAWLDREAVTGARNSVVRLRNPVPRAGRQSSALATVCNQLQAAAVYCPLAANTSPKFCLCWPAGWNYAATPDSALAADGWVIMLPSVSTQMHYVHRVLRLLLQQILFVMQQCARCCMGCDMVCRVIFCLPNEVDETVWQSVGQVAVLMNAMRVKMLCRRLWLVCILQIVTSWLYWWNHLIIPVRWVMESGPWKFCVIKQKVILRIKCAFVFVGTDPYALCDSVISDLTGQHFEISYKRLWLRLVISLTTTFVPLGFC